jgi:hypothetical protein
MKIFYVDVRYEWTGILKVVASDIEDAKEAVKEITFPDPWEEVEAGGHSLWIDSVTDEEESFWKEPEEGGQSEGDAMMTQGWEE